MERNCKSFEIRYPCSSRNTSFPDRTFKVPTSFFRPRNYPSVQHVPNPKNNRGGEEGKERKKEILSKNNTAVVNPVIKIICNILCKNPRWYCTRRGRWAEREREKKLERGEGSSKNKKNNRGKPVVL